MSGDPPDPGETEAAAAVPAAGHCPQLGAGQGPPGNGVETAGHQPPGTAAGVCTPPGPAGTAGADTAAPGPAGADTAAPGPAGADTAASDPAGADTLANTHPTAPGPAGATRWCSSEGNQNGAKKQVAMINVLCSLYDNYMCMFCVVCLINMCACFVLINMCACFVLYV